MRHPTRSLLLPLLLALAPALAASATVPGEVSYQGLLLDDAGNPVTGNEDFVFRLFDVPAGGSPVWSESHTAVPVLDGVYDVALGSITPITPGLVSGGTLHLEIEVGGEALAPRQRLLAVPYAVRAESAESADAVDALPSLFITQAFEHYAFDGQDPPNMHPSEGTADTDGDSLPNFLDPDNDDDGIEDAAELAQGSDVNLVTPVISGFDPPAADASVTSTVTVQGANFMPGLGVVFGTESPTPQNLTSTGFEVDVGPQPEGNATVVVTNANAESGSASFPFAIPLITSLDPPTAPANSAVLVTIHGSGFLPGLVVDFGGESPTPQNLTPTSFDVSVGPQPAGAANVSVSHPGGTPSTAVFEFVDAGLVRKVFVTSTTSDGDLGGIAGADALCASLASSASLPGTFLAWIGDATTDPASRFTRGGAYERVDGIDVASSFSDLTDGALAASILRDENAASINDTVWTGVGPDGVAVTAGDDACASWSSGLAGSTAVYGSNGFVTGKWTQDATGACSAQRHLYCFEQ